MATNNSVEYAKIYATEPAELVDANEWAGRLRIQRFTYTQSGAGTVGETLAAVKLPAGKVRVLLPLSYIHTSGLGTSGTIDVGWEAYTDRDGTAVAADPNGLKDGIDAASAGADVPTGTVGTDETYEFDSRDGVVITLQFNDNPLDDTDTVKGYFIYVND